MNIIDNLMYRLTTAIYIKHITDSTELIEYCLGDNGHMLNINLIFIQGLNSLIKNGFYDVCMNITMRGIDYLYDIDPHLRIQALRGLKF